MTSAAIPSPANEAALRPGAAPRTSFWILALGSVGVVYGDIGTSPLYALKESLTAAKGSGALTGDMVLGVVSLVLWALIVVVTIKYVVLVLRMDNDGEGGTLSLMALIQRVMGHSAPAIAILGMIGAALFYGDAIITPAISVLSAVEGLKLVTPAFEPLILPLSVAILVALFAVQSRGTAAVAAWFGPITALWFVAMMVGGLPRIFENPSVLAAVDPRLGIGFLASHGLAGLFALGAVFLAVTGAEALYADLGHFGAKPIRLAWSAFVFPALAINYLGQGALLLSSPEKLENPFYLLFPEWAILPMVVLASLATVIASQAVITGAFSMTQQAIQLGLLPRLEIRRTSETEKGQIYLPRVNWMLLAAVLCLVLFFKSSSGLASAYGIAVTGTMVVTAVMAFFALWKCWKWPAPLAALVIAPLAFIDVVFLGANLLKVHDGGWIPLAVGAALLVLMMTWRQGSRILAQKARREEVPLKLFIESLERNPPQRVRGTAVFLTGDPENAPSALLHNLKHNKILHAQNIVINVLTADVPRVPEDDRADVERLSPSFARLTLRFGFMETPNVSKAMAACRELGVSFDVMQTSFFLSRRALKRSPTSAMPAWKDRLFIMLARGAADASHHFHIPASRAVEVGTQVTV